MKNLFAILLCFFVLSTACNRSVDNRLACADSVIDSDADSAYTILKSIDINDLTSISDKAFYAVLYTQAQYKTFDSIPNDSLINVALDFYADNHNRNLYTRTLIYKGAVMQEMGKDDEAMQWYKRAENNAPEDDYMNKGLANMRMSVLYAMNYADNNETLEKERKALQYFRKAGSKRYELMCLGGLGGGYRLIDMDSAYHYLHQAIDLAKELNDDYELYSCTAMLIRAMVYDSLYINAKNLAISYINANYKFIDDDIYYDLAECYAKLGMVDSAQFYFDKTSEPYNEETILTRIMVATAINESKKDYIKAYKYEKLADSLASKVLSRSKGSNLIKQNKELTISNYQSNQIRLEKSKTMHTYIILLTLFIVIVLVLIFYKRKILHKKELDSYKFMTEKYKEEINKHKKEKQIEQNIELQIIAKHNIQILNEIKNCAVNFETKPDYFIKKLKNIAKELQHNDNEFWDILENIANNKYNNILIKIRKDYPSISIEDFKIITMILLNLSTTTMSICMGFTNEKSIYQKKKRIAQKMKISDSLDDFLAKIISFV